MPWFVPFCFGALLMGLILSYNRFGEQTVPPQERSVPAAVAPQPTQPPQTQVMVIITNTAMATEIPTVRPTTVPTFPVTINWCGTATPGAICEVPPLPTPTITPYPDCALLPTLKPKDVCRWN